MVKVVAPALLHPTNRTLAQFQNYWAESHGPLFANTKGLRRYVQHITLTEVYRIDPAPTFDGVSMFWYDGWEAFGVPPSSDAELHALMEGVAGVPLKEAPTTAGPSAPAAGPDPQDVALMRAVLKDDAQLFDRSTTWPMHHKRSMVWAREHVVVDGPSRPDMVKAIFIATKMPGLTLAEFFDHWQNYHGQLAAIVPGLRRYVQNHAMPEAYTDGRQTHDGWSELWFDDLAALHSAVKTPEWRALGEDGATLFCDADGHRCGPGEDPEGPGLDVPRLGRRRHERTGRSRAAPGAGLHRPRRGCGGTAADQAGRRQKGPGSLDQRTPRDDRRLRPRRAPL